jgi:hypothetical protein
MTPNGTRIHIVVLRAWEIGKILYVPHAIMQNEELWKMTFFTQKKKKNIKITKNFIKKSKS